MAFMNIDTSEHMLDLERSYAHIEQSTESLQRTLDIYLGFREMGQSNSLSVESVQSHYLPALRIALAGTSIDVEEFSAEGAMDTIKAFGKAVIEAIKRLFDTVIEAMSRIDLAATWMNQQINLLERKRITSIGRTPSEPKVTMGRTHKFLRVGRIFADDSSKLSMELRRMSDVITVINSDYGASLSRGFNRIASIPSSSHGDKLVSDLLAGVDDVGFPKMASKCRMSSIGRDRFGRDNVLGTPPLLGGQTLYFLQGNLVDRGISALRNHGFVFTTTSREPYKVDDEMDLKSLSPADLNGIPEILRKLITQVSSGASDNLSRHLRKLRTDIDRFITTKMNDNQLSDADFSKIRSTVNAYMYWTRSVTVPLYGNTLSVVRCVLSYSQLSVKTWR